MTLPVGTECLSMNVNMNVYLFFNYKKRNCLKGSVNDDRIKRGFGLGLPLVSRIAKLHKGEIKASSKLGLGGVFIIPLPAANC